MLLGMLSIFVTVAVVTQIARANPNFALLTTKHSLWLLGGAPVCYNPTFVFAAGVTKSRFSNFLSPSSRRPV